MNKRKVRLVLCVCGLAALLAGTALGTVAWSIQESVRDHIGEARQAHPTATDDVTALVLFMSTDTHSFRGRNLAVWTLGRLRAVPALPVLQAAYTGEPCAHDAGLCQYELEKAIRRCGGDPVSPARTAH